MYRSVEQVDPKNYVSYKRDIFSLIQDLRSENNFANIRNMMKDFCSRKTEVIDFFESEAKKYFDKEDFDRGTPWVDVSEKFNKLLEDLVKDGEIKQDKKNQFQRSAFDDEGEDEQVDQNLFFSGEYDSRIKDFIEDLKKCQSLSHKESVGYGQKKQGLNGACGQKKEELNQSFQKTISSLSNFLIDDIQKKKSSSKKEFYGSLKNLGYAFLHSFEEKDGEKNQNNEKNSEVANKQPNNQTSSAQIKKAGVFTEDLNSKVNNRNDLKINADKTRNALFALEKSSDLKADISNIQKSLKAIVSGLEEERKKETDINKRIELYSFEEKIAQYLDDIGKQTASNFNGRKTLEDYILSGVKIIVELKRLLESSDLENSGKEQVKSRRREF